MVGVKFGQAGDAERIALAREQAIRESGMAFIELRLSAQSFNGACGAEVLYATQYTDPVTRAVKFSAEVKGGPLKFIYDARRGGSYCSIPDNEWNRRFLRGVIDAKVVEITDKQIEADIRNGTPAPNSFAAPIEASAAAPQTIEELTAALNKARAAAGLPPILDGAPTATFTSHTPAQIINPPVETEREFVKKSEAEIEEIARKFCEDGERIREADVKPPEPVIQPLNLPPIKKAPAPKGKGKTAPKSAFIKMED
jgi:hypothetical protein